MSILITKKIYNNLENLAIGRRGVCQLRQGDPGAPPACNIYPFDS